MVWRAAGAGLLAGLAAGLAYVLLVAALAAVAAWAGDRLPGWREELPPLAIDLAAWVLGLLLAKVAGDGGWSVALPLHAAFALVAVEAARVAYFRAQAERRARDLREVTLAGHRIVIRNPDLLGIAEQIHKECYRILRFDWFQFELLGQEGGDRAWQAGPDRRVSEELAEPPPAPPTLPGIHRRAGWKIVEREFGGEEVIARLRLWCDPRRLEPGSLELLDSLLPQMVSSVQRALLDRVAKRDPLTDLPDRRALDGHLERVFKDSSRRGESMAVIMCDVDNFKKINDLNGHAVGDQALLVIARVLEHQRREEDFCCRLGGDEFAIVLEGAEGSTALAIADRIRAAVARRRRADLKTRIPLRLTAGVAAFPELHVREAPELLQLADEALYEAKRRGRNRCLLNLGRGRFQKASGDVLDDAKAPDLEPPTLFA